MSRVLSASLIEDARVQGTSFWIGRRLDGRARIIGQRLKVAPDLHRGSAVTGLYLPGQARQRAIAPRCQPRRGSDDPQDVPTG
jgi:hypothetical protein